MLCKCKLWLCTGLRRNGRNDNDVADEVIRNHQLIKTVVTCPVNQPRSVSDSVELVVTNVIECWSIARNVILQSVWFLCNFQCIRCQVSMFESRYPGGCCRGEDTARQGSCKFISFHWQQLWDVWFIGHFHGSITKERKKRVVVEGQKCAFYTLGFGWVLVILHIDLQPLATLWTPLSSSASVPHTSSSDGGTQ